MAPASVLPFTDCPILFHDAGILAVNKPAGYLSHPNKGRGPRKCAFHGQYNLEHRRFDSEDGPVWLIHRLDLDTSGVLLAATNSATAADLRDLFAERNIRKQYLALVSGIPLPTKGTWKDYIQTTDKGDRVRSKIFPGRAPNAELKYQVEQRFPGMGGALLRIHLITGRTHQIRVQGTHRRHPLLGDRTYGNFPLNRTWKKKTGLRRLFLHAISLEFPGPSGKPLCIESKLPDDLAAVLSRAT